MKEKIQQNLNSSIKERREAETLVLRMLQAAILNKEKAKRYKLSKEGPELNGQELEKKSQLTDEEIIEVISFGIKKSKQAVLEYEKGEREDLAAKEKAEIEILQKYL